MTSAPPFRHPRTHGAGLENAHMDAWGKRPTRGAAEQNTSSAVGSRKKAPWGRTSPPCGKGNSLSELWSHCSSAFLVVIFGIATHADLFLIHHHLRPSQAGPQSRCFGLSPGNDSDFVQGLICKILSYGRIFLQIFILL